MAGMPLAKAQCCRSHYKWGKSAGDVEHPRVGPRRVELAKSRRLLQWLRYRRLTIFSKTSVC